MSAPAPPTRSIRTLVTDVLGAVGLVAALVLMFALDRAAPAPPPADPAPAETVPDLPDLSPPDLASASAADLPPPPPPPAAEPATEPPPPPPEEFLPRPVDPTLRLGLQYTMGGATMGVSTIDPNGGRLKRLTYSADGGTNQTMVSVDGRIYPFGGPAGRVVRPLETPRGGPHAFEWEVGRVRFEQVAEFEAGPVSRKMDTVRVRYKMTNTDPTVAHTAGVRLMIDTLIGSNDGVPFFIPGRQGVIDRYVSLKGQEVPETVLALERPVLDDPTVTVAQFRFADGEKPGRLDLTNWPRSNPSGWVLQAADLGNDSAIGIYYEPVSIPAGASRSVNFTYGLGSLTQEGGPRNAGLKLYSPGPFAANRPFQLTAFVRNPQAGQKVRVTLPQGLKLAEGEAAEKAVELQPGVSITKVDWVVNPSDAAGGRLTIRADLVGGGLTDSLVVFVANPKPVVRELLVTGSPAPGGRFRVTAQLMNPQAGMTATLVLPAGLALAPGQTPGVPVTAGPVGQVSWLVDAARDRTGDAELVVRLTPNGTEGRRVVAVRPGEMALHRVVVSGSPSAGGAFRITAQVLFPAPGAAARLELPSGLTLAPGEAAEKLLAAGGVAQPSWVVRAARTAAGPASLTVRLTPGSLAATEAVTVGPAVRALTARLARDEPVGPGQAFWVVADVSNPEAGDAAELTVPAGFRLAPGQVTRKPLEDRGGFGRAAWAVVREADAEGTAELTVTAVGLPPRGVAVACRRGNLIQR